MLADNGGMLRRGFPSTRRDLVVSLLALTLRALGGSATPLAAEESGAAPAEVPVAEAVRSLAGPPRGEEVLDALERRAREVLARIEHPGDAKELRVAQPDLRRHLRQSLGLARLPEPRPRDVRRAGVVDRGEYVIEKLVWETFPGTSVPAHVYRPAAPQGKLPAVLFVPGHWWAESKTLPDFQVFSIALARLGFVVLSYDPIGQGERGVSTRDHRRTPSLLFGISQEGIVAYESLCALEYLLSREDVDDARVGITGASGGGYNSWVLAAIDKRIAAAVPVVGTSEFLEQIRVCRPLDWYRAKEHCHFVAGLLRYANGHEFIALAAPRPVLVVSAVGDESFPIPGIRTVVEYGRELYRELGAPERFGYFEDASAGHGYQRAKREAACGWFLRFLGGEGDGRPIAEPDLETLPHDDPSLRCFPAGANRPAGPGIVAWLERLAAELPERSRDDAGGIRDALAETLGIDRDAQTGGEADALRRSGGREVGERIVERAEWAALDGLRIPAVVIAPAGEVKGAILAAADDGGAALAGHPEVRAAVEAGFAALLTDVRGSGELAVDAPGWVFAVSLLLGESFTGRQALDLVAGARAVEAGLDLEGRPIGLLGHGPRASLAALYAALLEPRVDFVITEGGFTSYRSFLDRPRSLERSYALLGPDRTGRVELDREIPHEIVPFDALRRFDIPDLHAALGRRHAVVRSAIDGDWEVLAPETVRHHAVGHRAVGHRLGAAVRAGAAGRPFFGALADDVARGARISATHWTRDDEFRPQNAIDGDPATKWVGEGHPLTAHPTNLILDLEEAVITDRLVLVSAVHRGRLALKHVEVWALVDGGEASGRARHALLADARDIRDVTTALRLPRVRTSRLRIRVRDTHRDDHAFPRLHEIRLHAAPPGTPAETPPFSLVPEESKSERLLVRRALGEKIVFPGVTFDPEKGWLHYARAFLDTMLAEGTDRYGSVSSPMFCSLLDMETHRNPEEIPANIPGQRTGDRAVRGGNLFHDVMLLLACDVVSRITGDDRYERAATAYLEFFLEHCPAPATGLWPWGEHAHWDFHAERAGHRTHEYLGGVPAEFWDRVWTLDAAAVRGEADALLNHVVNLETWDFDRHADIFRPLPQPRPRGLGFLDFPRHAGFFIGLWSYVHGRTGDRKYLEWSLRLADRHWRTRDPASDLPLLATRTARAQTVSVSSALSLAVSLFEAAERLPETPARRRFERMARRYVERIVALPHRPEEGRLLISFPAGEAATPRNAGFGDPYTYGYGGGLSADDAILLLAAHRDSGDPRPLAIAAALGGYYADHDPPAAYEVVRAHVYASIVGLFLDLHALTSRPAHLEQARRYARLAVERLFRDGLFRGATGIDHYESDLMVANLVYALVRLHAVEKGLDLHVPPNTFNR